MEILPPNVTPTDVVNVATALVTIASVLANVIPKHTVVGKWLSWVALNFKAGK